MDIISTIAPLFERYITLERVHPTSKYDYKARGMFSLPVFECTMHRPKCAAGSWTYVAVPAGADLAHLAEGQRLYVGTQTVDRMFRGDGMKGSNFHHAQMRAGNGSDTPEALLRAGQRIDIYRLDATRLATFLASRPHVQAQVPGLLQLIGHPAKHPGYWLEQFILHHEAKTWRWNTSGADREVERLLRLVAR